MTTERARSSEVAVERWLQDQHRNLVGDLRRVLDLEAGLRDFRMERQHAALISGLRTALDLDTGLREILGASAPRPSPIEAVESVTLEPEPEHMRVEAILTARREPGVRGALEYLERTRGCTDFILLRTHAGALVRALREYGTEGTVRTLARNLLRAFGLDGELDRARTRAFALVGDLVEAVGLGAAAGHDREVARNVELSADLAAARAAHLAQSHLSALHSARFLVGNLRSVENVSADLAVGLLLRLEHDIDLARERDLGHAREQQRRKRAYQRDLQSDLAADLAHAHHLTDDIARAREHTENFIHEFLGVIDHIVAKMLSKRLPGVDLTDLVPGRATALLDDFTRADLHAVNLEGIDLVGLRWSAESRWPSSEIAADIKKRSRETSPGSGVFEIVGGDGQFSHQTVWA